MRCPGQDRRYWTEDSVFEVPCPECGAAVEFFKDEASGRCTRCGHRFPNPGMDFGCAKWCALAEQCLGVVPERDSASISTEGALAARLIQKVGEAFDGDPDRLTRTLKVFHHARQLVFSEGGDPRVVLAAALLRDVGATDRATGQAGAAEGPAKARQILQDIAADEETIRSVCEIVAAHEAGRQLDSIESRIVRDAGTLAAFAAEGYGDDPDEQLRTLTRELTTDAAKEWAQKWAGSGPNGKK